METVAPSARVPAPAGPKQNVPLRHDRQEVPSDTPAQPPKTVGPMAARVKLYLEENREKVKGLIPVKLERLEPTEVHHPFPPTPGKLATAPNPAGIETSLPLAPDVRGRGDGSTKKGGITPKIPDSGNLVLRIPRQPTIPATIKSIVRPRFFSGT